MGSFLNVVICRLGTKKKIVKDRSHCPYCQHVLSWQDLIPVLSFIFLKARCRYCGKKISWQYPGVEIAAGLLFAAAVIPGLTRNPVCGIRGDIIRIPLLLAIISFLIIIFVFDLKHYLIPDKIVFPAIGITFLYLFVGTVADPSLWQWLIIPLLSALGASLFFLCLVLITRGKGMGVGDVKLAFLIGLLLSWPHILTSLFIAFLSGGIIGIFLVLLKKKKMKSMVPFGPFLVAGTIIALFWGQAIINWYWRVLVF